MKGKKVLELGPLEGAHTYMLEKAGGDVLSIEGNHGAYIRCLIVKNFYGLKLSPSAKSVTIDLFCIRDNLKKLKEVISGGSVSQSVKAYELFVEDMNNTIKENWDEYLKEATMCDSDVKQYVEKLKEFDDGKNYYMTP